MHPQESVVQSFLPCSLNVNIAEDKKDVSIAMLVFDLSDIKSLLSGPAIADNHATDFDDCSPVGSDHNRQEQ
jgi:hypothetical protein